MPPHINHMSLIIHRLLKTIKLQPFSPKNKYTHQIRHKLKGSLELLPSSRFMFMDVLYFIFLSLSNRVINKHIHTYIHTTPANKSQPHLSSWCAWKFCMCMKLIPYGALLMWFPKYHMQILGIARSHYWSSILMWSRSHMIRGGQESVNLPNYTIPMGNTTPRDRFEVWCIDERGRVCFTNTYFLIFSGINF